MSNVPLYTLREYYIANPTSFVEILNGDSTTSDLYQSLVAESIANIEDKYQSVSKSTIVQMDLDGNVLFSNNNATFGQTKEDIKEMKGSVEKAGPTDVLVADPVNKNAFVLSLAFSNFAVAAQSDFESGTISQSDLDFLDVVLGDITVNVVTSTVVWQYNSSKYVVGFRLIPRENVTVSVRDDAIDQSEIFIRQGSLVIWENNSASPISVYSGTTTYDQFYLDPDLNLYGNEFQSVVINAGESWSWKFTSVGTFNYFVYPSILIGKITVTKNRISIRDQFFILENDGLESPFSSRVIKVDGYGNILWNFGDGYLVKPRDARPLLNDNVIIST